MRGLYLILIVVSLILIVFGIIFAILYAFENESKKNSEPGTYWGMVLGLGVGTALIGLLMFIVVIYFSQRLVVRAEISDEDLNKQTNAIKTGGLKYLTLDNREVINVYNKTQRENEIAAALEAKKRMVAIDRNADRAKTTIPPPGTVSASKLSYSPTPTRSIFGGSEFV